MSLWTQTYPIQECPEKVEYIHRGENFLISITCEGEPPKEALEKAKYFLTYVGERK